MASGFGRSSMGASHGRMGGGGGGGGRMGIIARGRFPALRKMFPDMPWPASFLPPNANQQQPQQPFPVMYPMMQNPYSFMQQPSLMGMPYNLPQNPYSLLFSSSGLFG